MDKDQREILFTTEDGEEVVFHILEQTRLAGVNYLLVETSNENDVEGEALILKDISKEDDDEAIYAIVEDDNELNAVGKIFNELLDDIELF
ncbi:MAG: DUF1292 domain-containing protein [Clostridiales bacterium]|jgi:uncharacterized protein YrzB (UPF0473 family)|nr:DUF1292 domain-containing protein [Clostridiales bacterium]